MNDERTAHVVVMGVSGTGKTTVATALAERLDATFAEGDDFHPQANVDKMRSGTSLTDEDRWPWLRDIAAWTRRAADEQTSTVVTCSALRRAYRDVLREQVPSTVFVHLTAPKEIILERMAQRDHYMPPSLLHSQLATLEDLQADERGVTLDTRPAEEAVVAQAVRSLAP